MHKALGMLMVLGFAMAGCDDAGDGGTDPEAPPPQAEPTGPTYHKTIQPLLYKNCVTCHREGGGAPFHLDDPQTAVAMASAALASIEAGRMPPWLPDPDCREYQDQRLLTAEDKAAFAAWVADGAPLGEPAEAEQSEGAQVVTVEPDIVAAPLEPYVADTSRPDDYRCFALDAEFAEDTFVRAMRIIPGDTAVVHHVLIFVVQPEQVETLERLTAEEEGPGYTCYGGSGLGNNGPMVGWAPGMLPTRFDDGVASYVPAGARLVMQVHYNTLAAAPSPDMTMVELEAWDEPQPFVITTQPLVDISLDIPAGEPESVHVKEFKNRSDETLEIVATSPHMHTLGRTLTVEHLRPGQPDACVVHVPDWDFNWQQTYEMREGETVKVAPGDSLRLTCVFDNSADNQPTVNGEQLEPRDVHWGDGTLDEMCLNYITLIKPIAEALPRGVTECRADCDDPNTFACVADCLGEDENHAVCIMPLFRSPDCATRCVPQALPAQDCTIDCLTESLGVAGGMAACMQDRCPDLYAPLEACMDEVMADGGCDAVLDACTGE